MSETIAVRQWSAAEQAALGEARTKLRRRARVSAVIAVVGAAASVLTIVLLRRGVFFVGAMVAAPLYAIDATRRLRGLDALVPGTPLDAGVLGVRTSADAPVKHNRVALAVLGGLIAALTVFIVVALAFG